MAFGLVTILALVVAGVVVLGGVVLVLVLARPGRPGDREPRD